MKPVGFLHIGLQKTGTTSIQQFLYDNNDLLKKRGFYYPTALGDVNHIYLAACNQGPRKIDDIRRSLGVNGPEDVERLRQTTLKKIDAELRNLTTEIKTIVLSNEHIHGRIVSAMEVGLLHDFVKSFCSSCKVVVYLRRQDKLAVSLYSTRFRAGATELNPVFPTEHLDFFDYNKMLSQFSDVFGKDHMIVRLFDKTKFVGGDLLSDFCAAIGLQYDDKYRRPTNLNLPLKPEAIRLFAELNKYIPRFVDGRPNPDFMIVLNAFDSLFCGDGPVADRKAAEQFYSPFREQNESIRQAFFPNSEGPLFDENFEEYPELLPSVTYAYEDAVKMSAEILRFVIKKTQK